MNFKKLPALVSTALAATLLLSACGDGNGSQNSQGPAGDGTLTVAIATTPISLDPTKAATGAPNRWFQDPAYESMINVDSSGKLIPGLANKWGYEGNDNTVFKATLREGLKFADGSPLGAKEAVAYLEYMRDEGAGPTVANFKALEFSTEGELTLVMKSSKPNPMMDWLLTPNFYGGSLVSPAGLKDPSQLAGKTFGAGEYKLDESQTVAGDHYVYVKNENFFDPESVEYEKITVRIMPNATQQVQALKTGQIDAIYADPTVAGTANAANIEEIHRPNLWRGVYLLDRDGTKVPALKNVKVRQALNHAVNREGIAKAAYGKYGSANVQPTLPGTETYGFDEELRSYYPYDPAKAKSLLAEAGYTDGFTMPLLYQAFNGADTKMVQAIAAQLAEVGVTVELKPTSNFGEWVGEITSLQYATTVLGAGGPLFFTAQFGFLPKGVLNPFNVSDTKVNEAFAALSSISAAEMGPAAKTLNRVLVEEAIAMPIAQVDAIFMYDKDSVGGLDFVGESGELMPITTWTQK